MLSNSPWTREVSRTGHTITSKSNVVMCVLLLEHWSIENAAESAAASAHI